MAQTFSYQGKTYTVPSSAATSSNGQLRFEIGACKTVSGNTTNIKIAVRITHNNPDYPGTYYCPRTGDQMGYGTRGPNDGVCHYVRFKWALKKDGKNFVTGVVNEINVSPGSPQIIVLVDRNIASADDLLSLFSFSFGWDENVAYVGRDGRIYRGYYGIYQNIYYWVDLNFNLNLNFNIYSATGSGYLIKYLTTEMPATISFSSEDNPFNTTYDVTNSHVVQSPPALISGETVSLRFEAGSIEQEIKTYNFSCKPENTPIFINWKSNKELTGKNSKGVAKTGVFWDPGDEITSLFLGGTITLTANWFFHKSYDLKPIVFNFSTPTEELGINKGLINDHFHGWEDTLDHTIYPLDGTIETIKSHVFLPTTDYPEGYVKNFVWVKTEDGWKRGFLWVKTEESFWAKSQRNYVKTDANSWQF